MDFNEAFYKDAYLKEADAVVISCEPCKKGYRAVLSDTIFYPEGGGQPSDRGYLVTGYGTRVVVKDVKRNVEDMVELFLESPVSPGDPVHQVIDWDFRFSLMQNHSGEHIVSGLINREYGFENVGFHMSDVITIDISGELRREQLLDIEKRQTGQSGRTFRLT